MQISELKQLIDTRAEGSQALFARLLGKSPSQVNQWLAGKRPIGAKIEKDILEKFGPTLSEGPNVRSAAPARGVVPVISIVRAGTWGEINDHIPDGAETFSVREAKVGPHAFALRVDGDSMTWDGQPNFPHGTMLIVDPDRSARAGDYVIAKNTDKQAALFKKLVTDGSAWLLKSLNHDFKPIPIEDPSVRIIGVVVEYWNGGKL